MQLEIAVFRNKYNSQLDSDLCVLMAEFFTKVVKALPRFLIQNTLFKCVSVLDDGFNVDFVVWEGMLSKKRVRVANLKLQNCYFTT